MHPSLIFPITFLLSRSKHKVNNMIACYVIICKDFFYFSHLPPPPLRRRRRRVAYENTKFISSNFFCAY